jgi:2-oxoisovalerate dehydrogenase E1 component
MAIGTDPARDTTMGPWDASAYPNIRVVASTDADLAATPRRTLGRLLFTIHAIRDFERWLLDHADLVHGPLHSSIGQEATAAGMGLALTRADGLTSTHRAHHDVLAKLIAWAAPDEFDPLTDPAVPDGVTDLVRATLAEVLGLEQGLCGGRGGSMHLAHPGAQVMTSAIVGGGLPGAAGMGLAAKLRGTGGVGVACFGDGATAIGAFHEAIAVARAMAIPAIFLLENNRYSVATSLMETAGFEQLAIRAAGYDIPAFIVDGMDPIAVLIAMSRARAHAVAHGPVFIEANTYRYYHQNGPLPGSAFKYRTRDEEKAWAALDPTVTFPARLVAAGALTQDEVDAVATLAKGMIAACVAQVSEETPDGTRIPDAYYPDTADVARGIVGPGLPPIDAARLDDSPAADGAEITYLAAVQGVIAHRLETDPLAFVLGEDVGHLGGGVGGLTKGALAVAPERVLNTPIAENGFSGAALGAALSGMHPIVELMYPDFGLEAADQLLNHIAKARYMFGGIHEVPLIVRTQVSRGRGYGPQHSADPSGLFALFPGWRIVAPSTGTDYIGLFNAAAILGDPVLVVDDNRLMKTTSPVPVAGMDLVIPPGSSRLVREGTDVTVVTWGYALHRVLAIVEALAAEGISVEIIDPRWLDRQSFDRDAVLDSVARTGALVIAEDALRSFGMGAPILDHLLPDLFGLLRTAPLRVTGDDVFSPVSRPLERHVHIRDADIGAAIVAAARAAHP